MRNKTNIDMLGFPTAHVGIVFFTFEGEEFLLEPPGAQNLVTVCPLLDSAAQKLRQEGVRGADVTFVNTLNQQLAANSILLKLTIIKAGGWWFWNLNKIRWKFWQERIAAAMSPC